MKFFANIIAAVLTLSALGGPTAFGAPVLYDADCLERMVDALDYDLDQQYAWESADTTLMLEFKKRPVRIDISDGRVVHVGYRMFSDSQREHMPYRQVFDFLERYALDAELPVKRVKSVGAMLAEDEVTCSESGFSRLRSYASDSTLLLSVADIGGRRYRVEWHKEDTPVYYIEFPIEYELLHGTSMPENERRLVADIQAWKGSRERVDTLTSREELVPIYRKNYYILPGDSYLLDNLTSNRYYMLAEDSDSLFVPIYTRDYPLESLATLLVTGTLPNDFSFEMKVDGYNMLPTVTVPVNAALDYFRSCGCVPFFGVGDFTDPVATCYLVMRNPSEGYCHLMRVTANVSELDSRHGTMACRLTPYIPMSRVASLFDD
ncbi:hypothetical protein [Muribaculum intestinale]|uniref:hypothetical protein n=1 Tax=Muribaculum intestinale TaxID=1796646 RepID=UPI0025B37106|nr:hypothetical protein [Muribaculum intestinale]